MSEVLVQSLTPEILVSAVLRQISDGHVEDATASFAPCFRFRDHGIGLEFSDKARLLEFFQKANELYPNRSLQTEKLLVIGDHVISQWTLKVTISEPFWAGLTRRTPISIAGVSIVRCENGQITDWVEYYDGLSARRSALVEHFTD